MGEQQKPSIGRIVHYHVRAVKTDEKLTTLPAIIYQIGEDTERSTVDLNVFTHLGISLKFEVPFSEKPEQDCWSWPPRT